ncbi:MAG: hypothetical protein DHS80DRAFT_25824 [Piptocephalis tieghemiana]|nr:MAG: hypothetical protein DHS80DRAFT_25824 [Piptocephalis tieghemiana]
MKVNSSLIYLSFFLVIGSSLMMTTSGVENPPFPYSHFENDVREGGYMMVDEYEVKELERSINRFKEMYGVFKKPKMLQRLTMKETGVRSSWIQSAKTVSRRLGEASKKLMSFDHVMKHCSSKKILNDKSALLDCRKILELLIPQIKDTLVALPKLNSLREEIENYAPEDVRTDPDERASSSGKQKELPLLKGLDICDAEEFSSAIGSYEHHYLGMQWADRLLMNLGRFYHHIVYYVLASKFSHACLQNDYAPLRSDTSKIYKRWSKSILIVEKVPQFTWDPEYRSGYKWDSESMKKLHRLIRSVPNHYSKGTICPTRNGERLRDYLPQILHPAEGLTQSIALDIKNYGELIHAFAF